MNSWWDGRVLDEVKPKEAEAYDAGYTEGTRDTLKEVAKRIVGDDPLFDSDHDNALVAAYLTEIAAGER